MPESTAARVAPTAAPRESANPPMTDSKVAASLRGRPPLTTIFAEPKSGLPVPRLDSETTLTLLTSVNSNVIVLPLTGSPFSNPLGRNVITTGFPIVSTVAIMEPA